MDHLQVICNGEVVRDLQLGPQRDSADAQGTLPLAKSGWCLLRAWNEKSADPVLDAYPYATTSPIYVTVGNEAVKSAQDAAYFVAWKATLCSPSVAVPVRDCWSADNSATNRMPSSRS